MVCRPLTPELVKAAKKAMMPARVQKGCPSEWHKLESFAWGKRGARELRGECPESPGDSSRALDFICEFFDQRSWAGKSVLERLRHPEEHPEGWYRFVLLDESRVARQIQCPVEGWHGTNVYSINNIIVDGFLRAGPSERKAKRSEERLHGVYCHKHATKHKAQSYMPFTPMPVSGLCMAFMLELQVDYQRVRAAGDQWVLQEDAVEIEAVWAKVVSMDELVPGGMWLMRRWQPELEAPIGLHPNPTYWR